jgi:hypothetical protein
MFPRCLDFSVSDGPKVKGEDVRVLRVSSRVTAYALPEGKKSPQPGRAWLSGFLAGVMRDAFVSDDETGAKLTGDERGRLFRRELTIV